MDSFLTRCSSVGMATMDSFIEMLSKCQSSASTLIARKETQIIMSHLILGLGCFITFWGLDVYRNRRLVSYALSASNTAGDNDDTDTSDDSPESGWEQISRWVRRKLLKMRQLSIGGSAIAFGVLLMLISTCMSGRVVSNLLNSSSSSSPTIIMAGSTNTAVEHCATPTFAQCYQTIAAHSHGMFVDLWKIVGIKSKK